MALVAQVNAMSDPTSTLQAMSEDITEADATEAIDPPPTEAAYAWRDELEESAEIPHVAPNPGNRPVIAVAALAAVALAIAAVAAVVALTSPKPQPESFTIRPAPVEQIPPPQAPNPAPPVAAPPAQHLAPAQAAPPPPDARQTFTGSLRSDTAQTQRGAGLYPTEAPNTVDAEAREMCTDLANGGSAQPYIDGTLQKSPTLAPWQAAQVVRQAIQSYCPQYSR